MITMKEVRENPTEFAIAATVGALLTIGALASAAWNSFKKGYHGADKEEDE